MMVSVSGASGSSPPRRPLKDIWGLPLLRVPHPPETVVAGLSVFPPFLFQALTFLRHAKDLLVHAIAFPQME